MNADGLMNPCILLSLTSIFFSLQTPTHSSSSKEHFLETSLNATLNDSVSYFKLQRLNGSYQSIHFGNSYSIPKSPSHQLEDLSSSVAVLIILDNWTNDTYTMIQSEIICGSGLVECRESPRALSPLTSEIFMLENGGGLKGVCGSFSFLSSSDNTHIHLMWSVPYNLNTYDTYTGVGVTNEVPVEESETSVFQRMYYDSNDMVSFFKRGVAGEVIEYSTCSLIIKSYIQPNNYKPIMSVSITPNERFEFDMEEDNEGNSQLPVQESLIQGKNDVDRGYFGSFNESERSHHKRRNFSILEEEINSYTQNETQSSLGENDAPGNGFTLGGIVLTIFFFILGQSFS